MSGRRAAFIDRDGVLDELVGDPRESPLRPDDVALIPDAAEALGRLGGRRLAAGWCHNQPATAKGTVPPRAARGGAGARARAPGAQGVRLDDFRICWRHPEMGWFRS